MICQESKEQLSRLGGSQTFLSPLLSFVFMKGVNNKFEFFQTSVHTIKYRLDLSEVEWTLFAKHRVDVLKVDL